MEVCFVLPDLTLSGGVGVVVQHARRLAAVHGLDVTLAVVDRGGRPAWSHQGLENLTVLPIAEAAARGWDLAVATWWETFYELPRLRADRRTYFVQSLEDRFYPAGSPERALAAMTYALADSFVTEASWIADFLADHRPEATCHLVRNGVDKDVFAPVDMPPQSAGKPLRILIEGHPDVWFKGVPEALEAAGRMSEPRHVTLVRPAPDLGEPVAGADRVIGPLSSREMADTMAASDVLLKLSRVEGMAGPPLEAFHKGATCVTTPVTGHDEYIRHGYNALVVGWDDPYGTARSLDLLSRDREFLGRLRLGALETARTWPGWDDAAAEMARALRALTASAEPSAAVAGDVVLAETWGQVRRLQAASLQDRVLSEELSRRLVDALDEVERWQARSLSVSARLNDLEAVHRALERDHRAVLETRAYRAAVQVRLVAERRPLRPLTRLVRRLLARRRSLLSRR